MAAKAGDRPVPERTIKDWMRDYRVSDRADRLANTHRISREAQKLLATHGRVEVRKALLAVANQDRSTAARLEKVGKIDKAVVNTAITHLRGGRVASAPAPESDSVITSGSSSGQKTRQRQRRCLGFSQSHLLLLGLVNEKQRQKALFDKSLQNRWTSDQLQQEIRKLPDRNVVTRPLAMSYAARVHAEALDAALTNLITSNMVEAVARTKLCDLDSTIAECDAAVEVLRGLRSKINEACKSMKQANRKLVATRDELDKSAKATE